MSATVVGTTQALVTPLLPTRPALTPPIEERVHPERRESTPAVHGLRRCRVRAP
jgi:hypothetical protein